MVSYPNKRCGLHPEKKSSLIWLGHGKSKSIANKLKFNALTCIDTASNLFKLILDDNKTAKHSCDKFTQSWLCWYPCPVQCLPDKGGKFVGQNFQWLLEIFSIKDVCSISKNLQSNAICENMHQTVTNVLRTLVHTNPPQNMTQARYIIDDALATAMHAMQTTVATILGSTLGALAFAWDMFLNVPLIPDWQAIAHTCEHHVNVNLQRANRKWRQFDYTPGQQVLKKVHNPTKLGIRTEGP